MIPSLRLVVTGGSGFVGRSLIKALQQAGHEVKNLDISIGTNITNWEQLKLTKDFDVLIHLAAKSYVPDSHDNPREFYSVNVGGTLNVLELCRQKNARMVFTSSYVYGIPNYLPINEEHPVRTLNPYSHTKIMGEELCKYYNHEFGVPVVILRPSNIYGHGQRTDFLIPSIINQMKQGAVKLNDSRPRRDFIHVNDMVNAYLKAVAYHKNNYTIFNIGSGESHSVKEVAEIILQYADRDVSLFFGESDRKVEVMEVQYDITKAQTILNWNPSITFQAGIKNLFD